MLPIRPIRAIAAALHGRSAQVRAIFAQRHAPTCKAPSRTSFDTRPMSTPSPRWAFGPRRLSAIALAVLTIAVGSALPTVAEAAKTSATTVVYTAPTPYSAMVGGIFRGTPVTMRCWIDSAWVGGTNRWFLVEGVGYNPFSGRLRNWVRGYASASTIIEQQRVGHC